MRDENKVDCVGDLLYSFKTAASTLRFGDACGVLAVHVHHDNVRQRTHVEHQSMSDFSILS